MKPTFSGYECLKMDNAHNMISIRNVDKRMGVLFDKESLTIKYIYEDAAEPHEPNANPEEVPTETAVPIHPLGHHGLPHPPLTMLP